jgi:hypothetical protein
MIPGRQSYWPTDPLPAPIMGREGWDVSCRDDAVPALEEWYVGHALELYAAKTL